VVKSLQKQFLRRHPLIEHLAVPLPLPVPSTTSPPWIKPRRTTLCMGEPLYLKPPGKDDLQPFMKCSHVAGVTSVYNSMSMEPSTSLFWLKLMLTKEWPESCAYSWNWAGELNSISLDGWWLYRSKNLLLSCVITCWFDKHLIKRNKDPEVKMLTGDLEPAGLLVNLYPMFWHMGWEEEIGEVDKCLESHGLGEEDCKARCAVWRSCRHIQWDAHACPDFAPDTSGTIFED